MSPSVTVIAAIAVDLVAVTILAGPLYFHRHRRRDLLLSYIALNAGVMGVTLALAGSDVGIGLGLGLFGVLSIVRLRSDQINQSEIAYYFTALALGLLAGIGATSLWMPSAFAVLLLAVLYVADHPRVLAAHHRRTITLDRAYLDEAALREAVTGLLGGTVTRLDVQAIDLVRDTTVVDVRYRLAAARADEAIRSATDSRPASPYPAGQTNGAAIWPAATAAPAATGPAGR